MAKRKIIHYGNAGEPAERYFETTSDWTIAQISAHLEQYRNWYVKTFGETEEMKMSKDKKIYHKKSHLLENDN